MAWEWSHTQEAYDNVRANIALLERNTLEMVFAEIKALGRKWETDPENRDYVTPPFFESVYKKALAHAKRLPNDVLADFIWDFAQEYRTCENGGHDAWICPYDCHTVPFSAPGEDDEEDANG